MKRVLFFGIVSVAATVVVTVAAQDPPAPPLVCSTKVPGDIVAGIAQLTSTTVAPTPSGYHPELALLKKHTWGPNPKIHVRFLNGSTTIRKKIQRVAEGWKRDTTASLTLLFDQSDSAQIRVSINSDGTSWSQVGDLAKSIPRNQPTMNFGWLKESTKQDEYDRVVLHEFGHALGAIHEHQSPTANIDWNKDVVRKYYRDNDHWDDATIDANIFFKYPADAVKATPVDEHSIMMYGFPPEFTKNGKGTPWNVALSPQDKEMIRLMYPPS